MKENAEMRALHFAQHWVQDQITDTHEKLTNLENDRDELNHKGDGLTFQIDVHTMEELTICVTERYGQIQEGITRAIAAFNRRYPRYYNNWCVARVSIVLESGNLISLPDCFWRRFAWKCSAAPFSYAKRAAHASRHSI